MAEGFAESDLSCDDFLGGRLQIYQPCQGYRAGVDPVFLAASIPAKPGETTLELGCGNGIASLCLGWRVGGLKQTGLELQPAYADLARKNAAHNDLSLEVITGDLAEMPADLRQQQFNHVFANPPYFDRRRSTAASDQGRETGLGENTPLAVWVQQAAKRVAPKGTVTFIHRAERLPELLHEMSCLLGSLEVFPLIPRRNRDARLVILRGIKGGRADFCLHDGWVLHEGTHHDVDRENHTSDTTSILREGRSFFDFR